MGQRRMWVLEGDLVLNISFPTHQPHQHLKTRKDSYQFPGGLLWGIKWGNPLKVLASVLVTEYSIKVIDHFIILIILLSFHYLNSFIVIIIVAEAGWILWLPQWSYKQHLLLLSERSHFLNGTKERLKTHQKKKKEFLRLLRVTCLKQRPPVESWVIAPWRKNRFTPFQL